MMYTQVRSSNGITLVPLETRLLSGRRIFIEGEINQETACSFAQQVMLLVDEDNRAPIDVWINSPGGEINAGLMMYDIIQSCSTPIRMICMGRAYSMAAVLFASGRHGRFMMANSELMLHEPLLGNRVGGNSSSLKSISDTLIQTKDRLNRILAKHTGKTEEEIDEATRFDHYFQADESNDFGLCDKIATFDELMKEAA